MLGWLDRLFSSFLPHEIECHLFGSSIARRRSAGHFTSKWNDTLPLR